MTSAHYPSQIPIMSLGKKSPTNLISQHRERNREWKEREIKIKIERKWGTKVREEREVETIET